MKKLLMLLLAIVMVAASMGMNTAPASATPGSSVNDPIVVSAPSEVPTGAVEDNPSTYLTSAACDTTRSWVSTKPGTNAVTHQEWRVESRTRTNSPYTEREYDKKVQYQKARWNGNTYIGPISYDYDRTTYRWRDYGLASVWGTSAPTAPGPVRGNYIHNYDGTWYYTTFYEYQPTGNTRTVNVYGNWSAWTAYGNNPYLSDPTLPANTSTKEYRKFGPVTVVDSAATSPVVTYYAWSDGKVCDVVTTPPTPTPEPPVVTPPTPQPPKDVLKPKAKIRSSCTGDVAYQFDNSKSDVAVTYKFLRNGKVVKNKVAAGGFEQKIKPAKAGSLAWIKAEGMKTVKTRVPGHCNVPHAGYRQ